MIIDHIMRFLQYDVRQLFGSNKCGLCCLRISLPFSRKNKCVTNSSKCNDNDDSDSDSDCDEDRTTCDEDSTRCDADDCERQSQCATANVNTDCGSCEVTSEVTETCGEKLGCRTEPCQNTRRWNKTLSSRKGRYSECQRNKPGHCEETSRCEESKETLRCEKALRCGGMPSSKTARCGKVKRCNMSRYDRMPRSKAPFGANPFRQTPRCDDGPRCKKARNGEPPPYNNVQTNGLSRCSDASSCETSFSERSSCDTSMSEDGCETDCDDDCEDHCDDDENDENSNENCGAQSSSMDCELDCAPDRECNCEPDCEQKQSAEKCDSVCTQNSNNNCDNDCDDDSENDCDKKSICQSVCQRIMGLIVSKCTNSTMEELETIENRAVKLWQILNANAHCSDVKYSNWWHLKSWQKLPFYWAALSNEILCEEPYENFKRFYLGSPRSHVSKRSAKQQNERALIMWHSLNAKQRLPFIVEAFISKVGTGKVNIQDEREIQRIIGELMRY